MAMWRRRIGAAGRWGLLALTAVLVLGWAGSMRWSVDL